MTSKQIGYDLLAMVERGANETDFVFGFDLAGGKRPKQEFIKAMSEKPHAPSTAALEF